MNEEDTIDLARYLVPKYTRVMNNFGSKVRNILAKLWQDKLVSLRESKCSVNFPKTLFH